MKKLFRLEHFTQASSFLKKIISKKTQFDRQALNKTSFFLFGVLIFCSQMGEISSLIQIKRNINRYRPNNIDYVVGGFFDPKTVTVNPPSLSQVAFAGQNVGGVPVTSTAEKKLAMKQGEAVQYTVAAGDTLSQIAQKYDLHSGSIALANKNLEDTETLQVGQILSIPPVDASDEELAKEFSDRQKKIAVAQPKTQTKSSTKVKKSSSFIVPLKYTYVSQYFGGSHTGIDYAAPVGTPIRAAQAGCVISISTGWSGGYGTMVHLSHGSGISTLYAHMSKFSSAISSGACVDSGEVIGYVGLTGRTTGAHLHYEYRVSGVPINPGN